jgi:N-acetylmuramoyl-L-alanine amidase
MSIRAGFPVAVVVGVSLLMAPAAAPQTLIQSASAVMTPIEGPRPLTDTTDTPAPIADMGPGPDPAAQTIDTLDARVAQEGADVAALDPQLECMAKVVQHEAANQPLQGQLAVAQLILNRVKSPLFPKTICGVANQPGQFFSTAAYAVSASSRRWRTAVAIARIARDEAMPQIAPGALFYHASYVRPSWARRRVVVARVGEHVFYR